jgi:myo-inositol-1(or 4)-monophosphatase
VALEAARAGAAVVREHALTSGDLAWEVKSPSDFVSRVDRAAEHEVNEAILSRVSDAVLLGEELAPSTEISRGIAFVADPLDGTTNFLHGLPLFAVSIALERQGQIVAGVIYNPAMDELYTAERGGGAFLNDRRLRVAARTRLPETVIGTGVPHLGLGHHGNFLLELRNVMGEVAGIRRLGAASLDLAYVAAGRLDGFWETPLKPWDIAAGILLIREAGGFATDREGGQGMFDNGSLVAGNETIHRALLALLKKPVNTK